VADAEVVMNALGGNDRRGVVATDDFVTAPANEGAALMFNTMAANKHADPMRLRGRSPRCIALFLSSPCNPNVPVLRRSRPSQRRLKRAGCSPESPLLLPPEQGSGMAADASVEYLLRDHDSGFASTFDLAWLVCTRCDPRAPTLFSL
jgi:hypothetical protein